MVETFCFWGKNEGSHRNSYITPRWAFYLPQQESKILGHKIWGFSTYQGSKNDFSVSSFPSLYPLTVRQEHCLREEHRFTALILVLSEPSCVGRDQTTMNVKTGYNYRVWTQFLQGSVHVVCVWIIKARSDFQAQKILQANGAWFILIVL